MKTESKSAQSSASYNIDRSQVTLPKLSFTQMAQDQLNLMLENDFTLQGKYLRILISGKGCEGFKYSIGFHDLNDDDFLVPVKEMDTEVAIDPFTAFYLGETQIDYQFNYINDEEGFVVVNKQQDEFQGKFWRKDKSKIPPKVQ
ncbi:MULTISPECIES: HesB/IscA family protein [Halobacteriovorax]|uniref:Core domain-containing protein n=1 Tax=Halobacteriovorax vibrionivorans TaxID=2152716 RepID=A0ABY0IE41_9BACT|nr:MULTISPECIES: iron-sulfur cluster biosynthesis family protein [Halobacteriovorax]RZF20892.1 hypothetical protein DAY19_12980 [Halobacteriovorax vibrionivorans]TGD48099.1 hypothetical protein EP118_05200 [Halobacteriovorax sp. Y22]